MPILIFLNTLVSKGKLYLAQNHVSSCLDATEKTFANVAVSRRFKYLKIDHPFLPYHREFLSSVFRVLNMSKVYLIKRVGRAREIVQGVRFCLARGEPPRESQPLQMFPENHQEGSLSMNPSPAEAPIHTH